MVAVSAAQGSKTVGKSELAAAIGFTRPKLDRRLESDEHFPIVKRGTRAGGWEFDLDAVKRHLGAEPSSDKAPPAIDDAQLRDTVAAPAPRTARERDRMVRAPAVEHTGERTAKQRLENAKAAREENKAKLEAAAVVPADDVRQVLQTMLARFGKGLDTLPDAIRNRLDLTDENAEVMRELTDELRRAMVEDLRTLMGPAKTGHA